LTASNSSKEPKQAASLRYLGWQQLFVIVLAWRLQIIEKMQYNAGHENGILIQTRSIIIAAENLSSELHDYF